MSIQRVSELHCDQCGAYGGTEPTAADCRREAKANGWRVGASSDLCPRCAKAAASSASVAAPSGDESGRYLLRVDAT